MHPLLQRRINGPEITALQQPHRLLKTMGNAVTQFRRSGFGEGDHQQLLHLKGLIPFTEKTQHQMGEGKGFAGACAGLQEAQPGFKGEAVGFEGGVVQPFTS